MKRILLLILIALMLTPLGTAALFNSRDITFSLKQNEYYFKTGKNAVVNLQVDNSYGKTLNGMLSYKITQTINQGNFQYSSSNTKSTSFSVADGKKDMPLNFGTSNTPITLTVDLKFSYTKEEAREVTLNGLKIHFVSDDSKKNNQQQQMSSSSQKAQQGQQQSNPFSQHEQQMQKMINQMMGNNQQPQNSQQALQNNQMAQDSSALKQQMQQQIQKQQQLKKEFQKQLAQNPKFQKEHQSLLNQGYNLTNANVNPNSSNTGDFELKYQKTNKKEATLKGRMEDGELKDIKKDTAERRQQILNQLKQDKKFQKFEKELEQQGFNRKNTDFFQEHNKSSIQVNYANKDNKTAAIKAEVINDTVQNVKLINENSKEKNHYLGVILFALLIVVAGYFLYKKFYQKSAHKEKVMEKESEKPFDYKAEALLILESAKELFDKKDYKEAYGKAGQALRLYLSYDNHLRNEITNDDIIEYLRKHKKSFKNAKECFNLCSLVEFAKYEANKKDFDKIISYAKKVID